MTTPSPADTQPQLVSYVMLGTNDSARTGRFYDAVLAPLGFKRSAEYGPVIGYGPVATATSFWIGPPHDEQPATVGNGVMVAFHTEDPQLVHAFHAAALAHGGTCEGPPGPRPQYGEGWYAAYVRDPDGNKVACVRPAPPSA